ncbi:symmetrical bis(5'-nucleosyl)-tetraphosphatase [Moritella sp. F3]|uniref:symmetrical bis(5'-nucleosyl)-tetraphosphatase n=1 Tax=Moritella sp. F3 TaxID=2718882 RepID=UPI0018E1B7D5|nr:symmetrical bis(5'-nucleosyl)-tetraphosphatase [Moritella sp. F3]GIC78539.1 bis(5'-nucleosyl)-tetraphosphatase, symmetrical [Moritella sp. F1]GIC83810.1 bis(5'-nucleosyl)-tetraphosphatase, symmetrical [Moritella sp. F3]
MATYFVGDIQGCFDDLQDLLQQANFDPQCDQLWLTGDLVARGPKSLETLRFVKNLGAAAITVLGNHDLHLLAIDAGLAKLNPKDKTQPIFSAEDKDELLLWLRQQPLLAYHDVFNIIMVHAGISPQWTQHQARLYAEEINAQLRADDYQTLLAQMYGSHPDYWQDELQSFDRSRFIINAFTRMRFCAPNGQLEFHNKHSPAENDNAQHIPWYEVAGSHLDGAHVIFGHWAALEGNCSHENATTLDTGCVWGNSLTMLRWEDKAVFSVTCPIHAT